MRLLVRYWLASLLLATAFFGSSQAIIGDDKTPQVGSFGVLQAVDARAIQKNAQSWLTKVGKTDAVSRRQFQAIWKQTHRSVVDRVADTLALGNADAAKLLAEASNPNTPAPTTVPALITDKKKSAFFRDNLALAYGRRLIHRRVYEDALRVLMATSAEKVVDPGTYLFHRAVCEHGMLQQKDATRTINRLMEEVVDSPERYKTVSVLMLLDMQTWKDKDLGAIARKMENIERRLKLARGGPKTQKLQREVIFRLDEIIKKLEQDAKKKKGGG